MRDDHGLDADEAEAFNEVIYGLARVANGDRFQTPGTKPPVFQTPKAKPVLERLYPDINLESRLYEFLPTFFATGISLPSDDFRYYVKRAGLDPEWSDYIYRLFHVTEETRDALIDETNERFAHFDEDQFYTVQGRLLVDEILNVEVQGRSRSDVLNDTPFVSPLFNFLILTVPRNHRPKSSPFLKEYKKYLPGGEFDK